MNIEVQKRAEMLREQLTNVSMGEHIQCSGIENNAMCSDIIARQFACGGCRAVELIEPFIDISVIGTGQILKEST